VSYVSDAPSTPGNMGNQGFMNQFMQDMMRQMTEMQRQYDRKAREDREEWQRQARKEAEERDRQTKEEREERKRQAEERDRQAKEDREERQRQAERQERMQTEQIKELQKQAREDRIELETRIQELQSGSNNSRNGSVVLNTKPPMFDLENDAPDFSDWKERWEDFLVSSGHSTLPESCRAQRIRSTLTAALAKSTLAWLNAQPLTKEEKSNPDAVIKALENHVAEQYSPMVMIASVLRTRQQPGEPFQQWWMRNKDKLRKCPRPAVEEDTIDWLSKLALYALIHDPWTFRTLSTTKNLTLAQAEQICLADDRAQSTKKQMEVVHQGCST